MDAIADTAVEEMEYWKQRCHLAEARVAELEAEVKKAEAVAEQIYVERAEQGVFEEVEAANRAEFLYGESP